MVYDTALGEITMVSDGESLVALRYGSIGLSNGTYGEDAVLLDAVAELNRYCFGQLKAFATPLDPYGDKLALKVYEELRRIPYGKVIRLSDFCSQLGKTADPEKVKAAITTNPIPIFIPCHRVIGDDGHSLGYPGGTSTQKKLLTMEKTNKDRVFVAPTDYKDQEDDDTSL